MSICREFTTYKLYKLNQRLIPLAIKFSVLFQNYFPTNAPSIKHPEGATKLNFIEK